MFNGVKRAVFFGAHTDDEMIAAGTLHRLDRSGCSIQIVSFGPAGTKEDPDGGNTSLEIVYPEWMRAGRRIVNSFPHELIDDEWVLPSKSMHTRGQEIADVAFKVVNEVRPDLCFILSPDDENPAHAEVGRQCERVMRGRVPLVVRCQFPWNYSIGRANLFVTLSPEDVQCKRDVINCYQSQLWRYRYEDMLLSYARADGLSVKAEYAEKFELLRGVV